eukprot:g7925.t1
MLYKDSCNRKSNQQNLGTIKSSNLCTEIIQYTAPDEIAVCNLASICLPKFVDTSGDKPVYNHKALFDVVKTVTVNLNRVIDVNYYPVEEARYSNMRHRPIGLGVQGLADAFILMRFPFESEEARQLNKEIFETMYFAAMTASCEEAERFGHYETYPGCPVSKGIFQPDMWNFTCVNKHLLRDLIALNIWTPSVRNQIIADGGSVQNVKGLPKQYKDLYKTVWEISQKTILTMAADRGAFIDQSQSLNVHIAAPSTGKLTSMHFYAWKKGLKTGMYYLRTRPKADAIQFTVDQTQLAETRKTTTADKENQSQESKRAAMLGAWNKVDTTKNMTFKKADRAKNAAAAEEEDSEICLSCGS